MRSDCSLIKKNIILLVNCITVYFSDIYIVKAGYMNTSKMKQKRKLITSM